MKNLVGQSFSLAETRYRIVDVQRLGAGAMVYAEQLTGCDGALPADGPRPGPRQGPPVPARTAFHYGDIADLLQTTRPG